MMDEIRGCRQDLGDDILYLKDVLQDPNTDLETKVQAAGILWDLSEQAKAALEPFKTQLRDLAREAGSKPGEPYRAQSADGKVTASVTVPGKKMSLRKGFSGGTALNRAHFCEMVDTVTTYKVRAGAAEVFEQIKDEDEAAFWLDTLLIEDQTPRVNFTRKKEV